MVFDKCCFCTELRKGCIIIAMFEMCANLIGVGMFLSYIPMLYPIPEWWIFGAGFLIHVIGHGFLLFGAPRKIVGLPWCI